MTNTKFDYKKREEEFDKEFPNACWADLSLSGLTTRYNASTEIKDFMRQTLKLYIASVREKVEAIKSMENQGLVPLQAALWKQGHYEAVISLIEMLEADEKELG